MCFAYVTVKSLTSCAQDSRSLSSLFFTKPFIIFNYSLVVCSCAFSRCEM